MTVATAATTQSKKLIKLTLSLFGNGFNSSKCKTAAKMAVARIKLLRNKTQVVVKQMRRDIALLLQSGQDATARIRVEHVIREQNVLAANEFIELFCELIVARLSIIKKRRECPADLKEGIASLIFASPRCAEIPELIQIRDIFEKKYGTDFVAAATDLRPNCGVNRMLIDKLSVKNPSGEVKLKIMKEIAKEHNIEWDTSESEKELLKPPEELIDGPRAFVSATSLPVKPATNHYSEQKEHMTSSYKSFVSATSLPEKPATNHYPEQQHHMTSGRLEMGHSRFKDTVEDLLSDSFALSKSGRLEMGHSRFKDTVEAAEAAEESARSAIAAAQAAAYLANRDSNLFSQVSGGRGYVPTCPPGASRMHESQSFGTLYAPGSGEVRAGNDEGGRKTSRRHSYNNAPAAHSDIKFDETHIDDDPSNINLPPSVPPSLDKQDSIHRIHPKLPDYDDLAARFEALKYRKSLP